MILQSWRVDSLKMCEISDEVIKFIVKAMKNCMMELTAGGKTLTEVKILRGIFFRDAIMQLLFIIAMMSLNYILRKYSRGYKFTKLQEKINHHMYIDDIELFAKK